MIDLRWIDVIQPVIVIILNGEHNRPIGCELKSLLESRANYRMELSQGEFCGIQKNGHPHLLIPILPRARATDLGALSEVGVGIPVLPLIRADCSSEILGWVDSSYKDFLLAPLRENEVIARVKRALRMSCGNESRLDQASGLAQLIGEDPAFATLKQKIPLVAQFGSTVLLTGETGTGKERCARALHYLSKRADNPFLPINCGAIPVDLFESELYGHQRGAFTGALTAQPGLIAEAEGGTLFLDEVETLGMMSQVKLLRFLQDQTYYSLGSARPRQANVWVIASTNVDLLLMVKEGAFREDLYYRLAVVKLALPPLRERVSDIARLAAHFLTLYGEMHSQRNRQLSERAIAALRQYSWPGNVRELENAIQQLLALTDSVTIEPEHLPIPQEKVPAPTGATFKQKKTEAIAQFEKSYIAELLRVHDGNVTQAGLAAGKERRALGRLIQKYNLKNNKSRSAGTA